MPAAPVGFYPGDNNTIVASVSGRRCTGNRQELQRFSVSHTLWGGFSADVPCPVEVGLWRPSLLLRGQPPGLPLKGASLLSHSSFQCPCEVGQGVPPGRQETGTVLWARQNQVVKLCLADLDLASPPLKRTPCTCRGQTWAGLPFPPMQAMFGLRWGAGNREPAGALEARSDHRA